MCPINAYAAFLQNAFSQTTRYPGLHPGLVCVAPSGRGSIWPDMPQSLSNILIHLIFSTKDRHPWLEPGIREKAHAFLAGAVRQCDCEAYRVGGVADHVHLALRLSRTISVAELVKEVKTASSKWMKTQDASLHTFAWQQGYGVFSVSMSQKEALLHYIDTQEEHHHTRTFQDEYRGLLKKYGIEYDERYVWD
jgi:putative transposase